MYTILVDLVTLDHDSHHRIDWLPSIKVLSWEDVSALFTIAKANCFTHPHHVQTYERANKHVLITTCTHTHYTHAHTHYTRTHTYTCLPNEHTPSRTHSKASIHINYPCQTIVKECSHELMHKWPFKVILKMYCPISPTRT